MLRSTFVRLLPIFALIFGTSFSAQAQEFEGIYSGTMSVNLGGETREVPLQLSLVLTGDTVTRPGGDVVQVIDGAFLVDGEGGAFPFTRVTFDLTDLELDMRYSRPMTDVGNEAPSSFRLIGGYNSDGTISGRVLSGSRGPLGTFNVSWTRQSIFARQSIYRGEWQGQAKLADGGEIPMTLELVDAEGATTNPSDLEFDYTAGKFGYVRWNNVNFSMNNVTIDYLRGTVTMRAPGTSGSAGLSFEFRISSDGKIARGQIKSAYRGQIATFELPSIED